jgi:hypothetical protein
MEPILLAVTVGSLLVALVMSAAAWRLSREERQRSAARVAALTAAATESDVRSPTPPQPVVAAANDTRAAEPRAPWPSARKASFGQTIRTAGATAQASARVPDLALHISARADELPLHQEPVARPSALGDSFLGSAVAAPPNSGQRGLAIAAGILFVVLAGGGYFTIFADRAPSETTASAAAATASPLELVSLRHERRGARLAVSGLVRNPLAGKAVERIAAVVFLFDQQGGFVTSARADVDFTRLAPGDESPFVISVDAPSTVSRYRVSFRTEAGVLPHVDRRGEEPIAPNAIGQNGTAATVR